MAEADPSDPRGPAAAGVSVILAVVVTAVLFVGLVILGLGMLSYFAEIDILDVPGLGVYPGVAGMVAAIAVYVLAMIPIARRPSHPAGVLTAVATALAHLAAVWLVALVGGAGLAPATAAVSQLVLGGSTLVIAIAAAVSAASAIALRRSRGQRPHWPWEDEDAGEPPR